MFLDCISNSDAKEQLLEISGGMVLSGNAKLRDRFTMVLRAKQFEKFLEQLADAYFPSAGGGREVRCIRDGRTMGFQIIEVSKSPNVKWKVVRVT